LRLKSQALSPGL